MYQNNYGVGGPNLYNNYYSPPPAFGHETVPSALSTINEAAAISILKHLNIQELEDLLNNDSKLQNLIDDLPQFKAVQREHDNLVVTTKSLAEYNLSFQPKIDALKRNLAGDYERANSLRTSLVERKAVLDSLIGKQSLDTVLALLQTETATTEEESEQLADSFCDGSLQIEEFLSQYLPKRTLAHTRRIKSEKFAELIRNGPSTSTAPTMAPVSSWGAAPSQPNLPPYPTHVPRGPTPKPPYPIGAGYGMPQPSIYH